MITSNNNGAISALKGYRVQFLYSLLRIISHKKSEFEFRPEGKYEDLDIYNENGEVIEIIQVKNYKKTLTLSDILSSKENTFIRRALNAYKENKTPKIKLISFGEINEDVKNLSQKSYSQKMIRKLEKLRLGSNEIKILQNNFEHEIIEEFKVKEELVLKIEEWSSFADSAITLDLLIYWIYYAAEKQITITPLRFKEQFEKISKFQSEQISFNKAFNTLIKPFDKEINTEDIERLKSDFYQGISATYKHILANVDVSRVEKLEAITNKFKKSNIVFIHGASGQGKSTLAYRYLYENCNKNTIFELKHLPEDILTIYEVVNALEGISKGISFPITLYIDVDPGNKEWINILKELASKQNFNFLLTIREEDWNAIEIDDEFQFSEIELTLEKKEAELIYKSLDKYNADLRFVDFENVWNTFGGNGPLLEFVYLITQNESLSSKLKSQINKIREDSSTNGKDKIKLLRYIVLADCFTSKVKYKELSNLLQLHDIGFLIELLQKEYLIKVSGNKSHITGLHPVRSEIIKSILFDNEIFIEKDYALDAISIISDNTILSFLRNAFKRTKLSPDELLEKLETFTLTSWQSHLSIFKSLLWKGIADYVDDNVSVLNRIYNEYNKGWITVVNFDFANVLEGGSMMENSELFSKEQRQYAKSINNEFSNKGLVFKYCHKWLQSIKQINCIPNNKFEWDAFALFLFWLIHFKQNHININYESFKNEESIGNQSIKVVSQILYTLKTYTKQSALYASKIEQIFLQKISKTYNIISIEQKRNSIKCSYIFDIFEEDFDSEESDFMNAKSMKIIDSLRFAFPNKDSYETKGVGHQFSFLPGNHDSSIKKIPKKNLPLKPLVEINSTFLNLYNYTKRPSTWLEYVDLIIKKRKSLLDVLKKMIEAFSLSHKSKDYEPLRLYVLEYIELNNIIKSINNPLLPKNVSDKWGEFGENGLNKEINTPAISFERYKSFEKFWSAYNTSIENFLWQSANTIISKIKAIQENSEFDLNTARTSLVGNLFKAFEYHSAFKSSFRKHFEKFSNIVELKKIESDESCYISSLCFLYRQFIYSNSFLTGNVYKTSLNRLKETDQFFNQKVKNTFKQLSRQQNCQFKVTFDENNKRCVIFFDVENTKESFELIEVITTVRL